MKSIKAIFVKQAKDMLKNPIALLPFLIFPVVALFMTEFVAKANEDIPGDMFVTMMAGIFAGFGLLQSASAAISEDIQQRSLRFLVLAGVKPHEYLLGIGGFLLLAGIIVSAAFGLIGGFTGMDFVKFFVVMATGSFASITLGTTIGMLSKNQQAAAGLTMPVAIIFGFTPMVAQFNETIERFTWVFYTRQINEVVNDFSAGFAKPLLVIASNIVVFTVLFILAYRKKGLKG